MLPPGHLAAGYLATEALLKIAKPNLPAAQLQELLYWGMFFSFAPDLDMFYAFVKLKSFRVLNKKDIWHRKFYSHAPLVWLIPGLLIFVLAPGIYFKYFGLVLIFGSFSHFILDSIDYGIMWLWPFSNKVYALRNPEKIFEIPERKNIIAYYWQFLKLYTGVLTFYFEILILAAAIVIFFLNH